MTRPDWDSYFPAGGTGVPPVAVEHRRPARASREARRTAEQNRLLHREAQARGLTHDDIHDLAASRYQVLSTRDMTVAQCADLIDFVRGVRHPAGGGTGVGPVSNRSRSWSSPGAIRSASPRQRRFIQHLMRDLGWSRPGDEQRAVSWLFDRHQVDWDTLLGGEGVPPAALSTRTASAIIAQLNRILLTKRRKGVA